VQAGRGSTLCDLHPYFIFGKGAGDLPESFELGPPVRGDRKFWLQHYIQQKITSPVVDPDTGHHALPSTIFRTREITESRWSTAFLFASQRSRFGVARMGESTDPLVEISFTTPVTTLWREDGRHDSTPGSSGQDSRCSSDRTIIPVNAGDGKMSDHRQLHFYGRHFPSDIGRPLLGLSGNYRIDF